MIPFTLRSVLKSRIPLITGLFMILIVLFFSSAVQADGKRDLYITKGEIVAFTVEEDIQVVEVLNFENNRDETDGISQNEKFKLKLPLKATNVRIIDGLDLAKVRIQDGWIIYEGMLPKGLHQISLLYLLKQGSEKGITLQYEQPYWAEEFRLTVPAGELSVTGERFLPQSDTVQIKNTRFRRFTRLDLHPGTKWNLRFQKASFKKKEVKTDEHANEEAGVNEDGYPIIGHVHGAKPEEAVANILFVASIFVIGLLSIRYTYAKKRTIKRSNKEKLVEKERLLNQLEQLKYRMENGEITLEEYQKNSNSLYQRLKEIARELKKEIVKDAM